MKTFSELFNLTMNGAVVEPKQRMVGGSFGWAVHRFPIKGGITLRQVMASQIMATNALYRKFCEGR